MLKRTFVVLAKLLLLVAVVWLMVLAYWKYANHVVTSEDLLMYFLILPVGLLLAFFLFRILWWSSKKIYRRFHAPASSEALPVGVSAGEPGTPRSADLYPPTYVIATAISTYFGDEGSQVLQTIMQEKTRAEIHAEFTQELGYGMRVAGVESLELAPTHEDARSTLWRTLALLEKIYEPLGHLLRQAAPDPESTPNSDKKHWGVQLHPEWKTGAPHPETAQEAITAETPFGALPTALSVHIVLPPFLTLAEINLAQVEVMTWLQSLGWPKQVITALPIQPENEIEYLRRLQAWQQRISRDSSINEWLLILSAVSWLDMDLLNDKLQKDRPFADRLARGGALIGEASCGMVLATTLPDQRLEPLTQLSLFTLAQRNKPVDAKGSIEAELLIDMLAAQVSAEQQSVAQIVGLVTSGDLNDGRAVELGRWVTDALPQLDFIEDVINVSEHIGDCGTCSSVLALTLAAAMAHEREGKALYCANQHASWRALAVAQPVLATSF